MVARRNFLHQVASVATGTSDGRAVLLVAGICALTWLGLVYCVSVSRSLVLTGAAWLTVFALFSLASSLISLALRNDSPSESFSFGLARAPVLAVFSSTVLAQLSAIFLIKEAVERLIEGDEAHPHAHQHLFIPGTIAACVAQLLAAYAVRNDPFTHVLTAASSSWLQEHAADFSHAICYVIPGASRLLLPRLNPLALLTSCAAVCCLVVHYLVVRQAVWWADPAGALCLSFAVFGSLWPLSTYTGRILLQTSPPHVLNQLDRCVREASTLDGVLELRNAHFWQLDFSSMAGSVDVRVRRDADEQMVLAHVVEKLSAVVSTLTVSVVKDTDFASALAAPWHAAVAPAPTPAAAAHHGHSHGHGHSHDDDDHHGHSHDHHGHSHDHHGHSHDDEHVIHHDHH